MIVYNNYYISVLGQPLAKKTCRGSSPPRKGPTRTAASEARTVAHYDKGLPKNDRQGWQPTKRITCLVRGQSNIKVAGKRACRDRSSGSSVLKNVWGGVAVCRRTMTV